MYRVTLRETLKVCVYNNDIKRNFCNLISRCLQSVCVLVLYSNFDSKVKVLAYIIVI